MACRYPYYRNNVAFAQHTNLLHSVTTSQVMFMLSYLNIGMTSEDAVDNGYRCEPLGYWMM